MSLELPIDQEEPYVGVPLDPSVPLVDPESYVGVPLDPSVPLVDPEPIVYEIEDVTPQDSVSTVYLDPTPIDLTGIPVVDIEDLMETKKALQQSGIAKLVTLGLTEEEARAIVDT